jgi:DNA-directed RNA polymerase sigma subunit (sigma70/sigma32)
MIRLELSPEIEAQLAAGARARGLALDQYVTKLVASRAAAQPMTESAAEAVAAIRELRKGNRLDGLKIADLIQEGRRY